MFFRQFNVVLKEDPASVFSPEVEIENTLGPVVYDVSRVYTGTLEGKLDFMNIFFLLSFIPNMLNRIAYMEGTYERGKVQFLKKGHRTDK